MNGWTLINSSFKRHYTLHTTSKVYNLIFLEFNKRQKLIKLTELLNFVYSLQEIVLIFLKDTYRVKKNMEIKRLESFFLTYLILDSINGLAAMKDKEINILMLPFIFPPPLPEYYE